MPVLRSTATQNNDLFTDNKVPREADFIPALVLVLTNNLLKQKLFSSLYDHNSESIPGEETHVTILIKTFYFHI